MPNVTHHSLMGGLFLNILGNISTGAGDVIYREEVIRDYGILEVTTGHAANAIILPASAMCKGRVLTIVNKSGLAVLVKRAGQVTPITVATTKSAMIYCNGVDYIRLTPDA